MKMRNLLSGLVLSGLCFLPSVSWADVSLGPINVYSQLRQPLNAMIQVNDADAHSVRARLASDQEYAAHRMNKTPLQRALRFATVSRNGRTFIKISSSRPVNEPFVNFLIKVEAGGQKIVREYSAFPEVASSDAGYMNPLVEQSAVGGAETKKAEVKSVSRSEPPANVRLLPIKPLNAEAQETTQASRGVTHQVKATPSKASSHGKNTYGPVQSGETLYMVARAVRPSADYSLGEVVRAIYRLNPKAFRNGKIDGLMAGYVLKLPDFSNNAWKAPKRVAEKPVKTKKKVASKAAVPALSATASSTGAAVAKAHEASISQVIADAEKESNQAAVAPVETAVVGRVDAPASDVDGQGKDGQGKAVAQDGGKEPSADMTAAPAQAGDAQTSGTQGDAGASGNVPAMAHGEVNAHASTMAQSGTVAANADVPVVVQHSAPIEAQGDVASDAGESHAMPHSADVNSALSTSEQSAESHDATVQGAVTADAQGQAVDQSQGAGDTTVASHTDDAAQGMAHAADNTQDSTQGVEPAKSTEATANDTQPSSADKHTVDKQAAEVEQSSAQVATAVKAPAVSEAPVEEESFLSQEILIFPLWQWLLLLLLVVLAAGGFWFWQKKKAQQEAEDEDIPELDSEAMDAIMEQIRSIEEGNAASAEDSSSDTAEVSTVQKAAVASSSVEKADGEFQSHDAVTAAQVDDDVLPDLELPSSGSADDGKTDHDFNVPLDFSTDISSVEDKVAGADSVAAPSSGLDDVFMEWDDESNSIVDNGETINQHLAGQMAGHTEHADTSSDLEALSFDFEDSSSDASPSAAPDDADDSVMDVERETDISLDLAASFIATGNGERAKKWLHEAMELGNDAQRAKAEKMLRDLEK